MAIDEWSGLAGIYAEALFELSEERQLTGAVREDLGNLADLIASDQPWELFLESPRISSKDKSAVIKRVLEGKVSDLTLDFLLVVADKDRLGGLRAMERYFGELEDKKAGRIKGKLTTAVELDSKETARLTEQIGRALRKTVTLEKHCDPAIIGGMILNIGDTVIDGSVQGSLERLARYMQQKSQRDLGAAELIVE
ncbi:MAG: ATP synthase F1 subunit delta [Planctomycetes bacterium]|nr:ATP synthase F1 subunit delta [Planctomycetota bacterium]